MIEAPKAPAGTVTLRALLAADTRAFLRNLRALVWTIALPLLVLFFAQGRFGATAGGIDATFGVVSLALMLGIYALGLFGYAIVLAGDRDRGVFARLRCSPASAWQLLGSRLLVQLLAVAVQTAVLLAVASTVYGAAPGFAGALLAVMAALLSGFAALAVGQAIVAFVASPAGVSAVSRVLLIAFLLLQGVVLGRQPSLAWLRQIGNWTPIRMSTLLLRDALVHQHWAAADLRYLAGLLVWIVVLGYLGITRFRWQPSA